MRRATVLVLAATASLGGPGVAAADVFVKVPTPFLGGPIWTPMPATSPLEAGRPSVPPPPASDACRGETPADCVVIGPEAQTDVAPLPTPGPGGVGVPVDDTGVDTEPAPEEDVQDAADDDATTGKSRAVPAVPPSATELAASYGGLLHPAPAAWLAWQRPTLRWRPRADAGFYNVQIFRGGRRVLNAWTSSTALRVPDGVLEQGRTYVWSVWPGAGPRRRARFGPPIGRSTFAVTLRPRIVFTTPGGRRGSVGQVRPPIPFATIRLSRPGALARRVPPVVTLDRRGRMTLPISSRAAERLSAVLTDRGPAPPVGLRGPGL